MYDTNMPLEDVGILMSGGYVNNSNLVGGNLILDKMDVYLDAFCPKLDN